MIMLYYANQKKFASVNSVQLYKCQQYGQGIYIELVT